MECCENQNISYKNYANVCIYCGVIFDYEFVHENIFKDYNMHISNMLQYKKMIYRRKKYLYKSCSHFSDLRNSIYKYTISISYII